MILTSKHLAVTICEPDAHHGTRFDRSGSISQVRFNDGCHFCEPEGMAAGLCSEISIVEPAWQPAREALYPKFGVGLLQLSHQHYDFAKQYPCDDFPITADYTDNCASFTVEPLPYKGFGLRQEKKVIVDDCAITVEYGYENVGSEALVLEEYCHNFVSLNGALIDRHHHLKMPMLPSQEGLQSKIPDGSLVGTEYGFSFNDACMTPALIEARMPDKSDMAVPFQWTLYTEGGSCRITEETDADVHHVVVWAVKHIVSPEIVTRFSLLPNQRHSYQRKWTFAP